MKRHCLWVAAVVLAIGGCGADIGSAPVSESSQMAARRADMGAAGAPPVALAQAEAGGEGPGVNLAVLQASQQDRFLVKNGTLSMEVADARETADEIVAAADAAGGYVANLNESLPAVGTRRINLQVRVPADRFEETLERISGLGKVLQRSVRTEEVTEQFLDTDARLRNLKQTEQRILEHLQRAAMLDEVLRIEQEITRVRQEIESLEGRLRFLGSRIAFSTLDISVQEAAQVQAALPPESYSAGGELAEAFRSLVGLLRGVLTLVIWVGVYAVIWVPLAIIVWFIARRIRRELSNDRTRPGSPVPPDLPVA